MIELNIECPKCKHRWDENVYDQVIESNISDGDEMNVDLECPECRHEFIAEIRVTINIDVDFLRYES